MSISIHAPHARSDVIRLCKKIHQIDFNPRSSCEERPHLLASVVLIVIFQSTLLMRGATRKDIVGIIDIGQFQSTLLMRGATLPSSFCLISVIHFNPRSSCEERRRETSRGQRYYRISIHAPHARSDSLSLQLPSWTDNFNPRSSCEERLRPSYGLVCLYIFQSTLLMRGATVKYSH